MKKTILLTVLLCFFVSFPVQAAEDTCISETAYNACVKYGGEYGICPEILMSIAERESSGNPEAENEGCKGIMQINVKFHGARMERLGCTDIFDEEQNIHVAADYLSELLGRHEDIYFALMAYNMGEAKAMELFGEVVYENEYAEWICERSEELEKIHGK